MIFRLRPMCVFLKGEEAFVSRHTFFWLLSALFIVMLIVGPVRHLRSGVMEYRKRHWGESRRRLLRRDEPEKFYLYVAVETLMLIFFLVMAYLFIYRG
ncbi:MAG TPA: hypothetical protein VIW80_22035 [Pyrinomonadaceae bacterium]